MQRTIIKTPEGHRAQLTVQFREDGATYCCISDGGSVDVRLESQTPKDARIVAQAIADYDTLQANLQPYAPTVAEVESPW